jgi:hypothetical protein
MNASFVLEFWHFIKYGRGGPRVLTRIFGNMTGEGGELSRRRYGEAAGHCYTLALNLRLGELNPSCNQELRVPSLSTCK